MKHMERILAIKSHFEVTAFTDNEEAEPYIVSAGTKDILVHCAGIEGTLATLRGVPYSAILIETPFIPFTYNNNTDRWDWANKIATSQRKHGIILYLLHKYFPDSDIKEVSSMAARKAVYNNTNVTLDILISIAQAKYKTYKKMSTKAELCVADCIILQDYWSAK